MMILWWAMMWDNAELGYIRHSKRDFWLASWATNYWK